MNEFVILKKKYVITLFLDFWFMLWATLEFVTFKKMYKVWQGSGTKWGIVLGIFFFKFFKKRQKLDLYFIRVDRKEGEMSLIAILQQNSWECLYEAFSNKLVWIFSASLNFGVLLNGVKIPIESTVTFFLCRLFMTTWRKTWKGDVSISKHLTEKWMVNFQEMFCLSKCCTYTLCTVSKSIDCKTSLFCRDAFNKILH